MVISEREATFTENTEFLKIEDASCVVHPRFIINN